MNSKERSVRNSSALVSSRQNRNGRMSEDEIVVCASSSLSDVRRGKSPLGVALRVPCSPSGMAVSEDGTITVKPRTLYHTKRSRVSRHETYQYSVRLTCFAVCSAATPHCPQPELIQCHRSRRPPRSQERRQTLNRDEDDPSRDYPILCIRRLVDQLERSLPLLFQYGRPGEEVLIERGCIVLEVGRERLWDVDG